MCVKHYSGAPDFVIYVIHRRKAFLMLILNFEFVWPNLIFGHGEGVTWGSSKMNFFKHDRRKSFLMWIFNFVFVWSNLNFWARGVFILFLGPRRGSKWGSSKMNLSRHGDVIYRRILTSPVLVMGLFCIRAATAMLEIEVEHGAMNTLTMVYFLL